MSDREDNDSDAPEEFTAEQGIKLDEEIRKIKRENAIRVNTKEKERRRKWAQNITPRPSKAVKKSQDVSITESEEEPKTAKKSRDTSRTESQQKPNTAVGFLPQNIVDMLAAREKKTFLTDTNEDKDEDEIKPTTSRKRKSKDSGSGPRIVTQLGPPPCLQSALDFLKERKMSVPRSSAVLKNSKQALRLLSSSGIIRQK
ncbi:hypothetical protein L195_g005879 [Trifolium pratense]|uniref:Uncharacterized protein n=2 Tax=Trifolium pratense TaxID=57577 RepID=A0A2K3P219_TRIPR|nr:uncharacterized protein LOC123911014 [Trifolium pratense]PNY09332.1 hypothetical protein L195_g005879 [Trifolium pratense]CAJ2646279.1 unnamed protein product [Trifolium pratense]